MVHALKYLTSTNEFGISFNSNSSSTIQAFNHFPHLHNKEAYIEATAPSPSEYHQLTAFCDACWGSQFGSAVIEINPIELFKIFSLYDFLIFRSGGSIVWESIRQNQTALSSCESEIMVTNQCTTELQSLKHRVNDIEITETYDRTKIYNNNKAAVRWAASVTSKGIKRLNLIENMVREFHQSKDVDVEHIPVIISPSDIFIKEMKDDTHFRNLRDSMMISLQASS